MTHASHTPPVGLPGTRAGYKCWNAPSGYLDGWCGNAAQGSCDPATKTLQKLQSLGKTGFSSERVLRPGH
eukprot:11042597-Prorocentrum_lima.AAC.1